MKKSASYLFYEAKKKEEKESSERMQMLHNAFRLSLAYPDAPITRRHLMDGKIVDMLSVREEYETSGTKIAEIYRIVTRSAHPISTRQISEKTGYPDNIVQNSLTRLVAKNKVTKSRSGKLYLYWK